MSSSNDNQICPICKKAGINPNSLNYDRYFCKPCEDKRMSILFNSIPEMKTALDNKLQQIKDDLIKDKVKQKEEMIMKLLEDEDDDVKLILLSKLNKDKKNITSNMTFKEKQKAYDASRSRRPDRKVKVKCLCGGIYAKSTMSNHIKTKQHSLTVTELLVKGSITQEEANKKWSDWDCVKNYIASNSSSNNTSVSSSNVESESDSDDESDDESDSDKKYRIY